MAISDRITSIEQHIKESYQELEGIGIDTTEVDKNLENIPKLIDGYWETLPKVTGEGTSITLDNTKEGKMKINLKGNTSQETTTGKNKLPILEYSGKTSNSMTTSCNGVDYTINGTLSGTWFDLNSWTNATIPAGRYLLSLESSIIPRLTLVVKYLDESSASFYISGGRDYVVVNLTQNVISYRLFSDGLTNGQAYNGTIKKLLLEAKESGEDRGDYEPYTNGASPNPDYPQDIHVVSGDNSINVVGKNLIPFSDIISTGGTTSNGITFTLQADGTIKANGTATAGISIYLTTNYIEQKAGTYTFSDGIVSGQSGTTFFLYADVRHLDETSWDTKNFSTAETTTRTRTIEEAFKFKPRIVVRQGQVLNNLIFKPMLEKGSTATTYEEYKGASYPISLGVANRFNTNGLNQGQYNANASLLNNRITWYGKQIANGDTITVVCNNSNLRFNVGRTTMNTNNSSNVYSQESGWQTGTHTITYNSSGYACVIIAKVDNTNVSTSEITNNDFTISYNGEYISPTPIELCKIGDYQDSIKKSTGKNLYSGTYYTKKYINYNSGAMLNSDDWSASDYIEIKPNANYTLSGITNSGWVAGTSFYDSSKTFISSIYSTVYSFSTPANAKYLRFSMNSETPSNIMLNEGSTALPYEPYGKVWYLNKQIGKVVLNGSETWTIVNSTATNRVHSTSVVVVNSNGELLSNYFTYNTNTWKLSNGITGIYRIASSGNIIISDTIKSDEEFKAWLSTHNTTVYYVLPTPTYTEITDTTLISQLEALNGARSYTTQTNINQDNNDNASVLNASALS